MIDILSWFLFATFIAALIVVAALLVRGYMSANGSGVAFGSSLFQPKADRRLQVVEQANLDGRRKLVIVRRDTTEHLIMVGGPVDIVVETGIDVGSELRAQVAQSQVGQPRGPRMLHAGKSLKAANGE